MTRSRIVRKSASSRCQIQPSLRQRRDRCVLTRGRWERNDRRRYAFSTQFVHAIDCAVVVETGAAVTAKRTTVTISDETGTTGAQEAWVAVGHAVRRKNHVPKVRRWAPPDEVKNGPESRPEG